jgi:hypothetical protein
MTMGATPFKEKELHVATLSDLGVSVSFTGQGMLGIKGSSYLVQCS